MSLIKANKMINQKPHKNAVSGGLNLVLDSRLTNYIQYILCRTGCQAGLWKNLETVEVRGFAPRRPSVVRRGPALSHPHRNNMITESVKMKNLKLLIIIFNFSLLIFNFLPGKADAGFIVNRTPYFSVNDGLVGYWTFDGQDLKDTTAFDKSGNNNNGTLTNGPRRAIGRLGQALEFDGNNDYVAIPNTAALQFVGTSAFTISAWINGTSQAGSVGVVFGKYSGTRGYRLLVDTSNTKKLAFQIRDDTGTSEMFSSDAAIVDGVWTHVTGVFSQGTLSLYIDGTLNKTAAFTKVLASGTDDARIGESTNSTFTRFLGLIDDVRVYNRALNEDEIKRLYNMGR